MIDKDIMRDFIKRSFQEDVGTGDITTIVITSYSIHYTKLYEAMHTATLTDITMAD